MSDRPHREADNTGIEPATQAASARSGGRRGAPAEKNAGPRRPRRRARNSAAKKGGGTAGEAIAAEDSARLFVALPLSPSTLACLAEAQAFARGRVADVLAAFKADATTRGDGDGAAAAAAAVSPSERQRREGGRWRSASRGEPANVLRWTAHSSWHITLHFIGATPRDEIPALVQRLRCVAAGSAAVTAPPRGDAQVERGAESGAPRHDSSVPMRALRIRTGGLAVFPPGSPRRFRVLHVEMHEDKDEKAEAEAKDGEEKEERGSGGTLRALAAAVRDAVEQWARDMRPAEAQREETQARGRSGCDGGDSCASAQPRDDDARRGDDWDEAASQQQQHRRRGGAARNKRRAEKDAFHAHVTLARVHQSASTRARQRLYHALCAGDAGDAGDEATARDAGAAVRDLSTTSTTATAAMTTTVSSSLSWSSNEAAATTTTTWTDSHSEREAMRTVGESGARTIERDVASGMASLPGRAATQAVHDMVLYESVPVSEEDEPSIGGGGGGGRRTQYVEVARFPLGAMN